MDILLPCWDLESWEGQQCFVPVELCGRELACLPAVCPESLHSSFVAACPEAMWVPLPRNPGGRPCPGRTGKSPAVSRSGRCLGRGGRGSGRSMNLIPWSVRCAIIFSRPVLLDADALRPEIIDSLKNQNQVVLTPHAGELDRIRGEKRFFPIYFCFPRSDFAKKGPIHRLFRLVPLCICFPVAHYWPVGGAGICSVVSSDH